MLPEDADRINRLKSASGKIVSPEQAVAREDSLVMVCRAGTALAAIQGPIVGTGPAEERRITEEVKEFQRRFETDAC